MIKKPKPILETLAGKKPEHTPIWLMRQAGRYLPEYRKLRSQAGNFLDLCLTPKFATEITLQPIRRFGFDAAILFADILLIPHALGQKLEFREGEGPRLEGLETEKDLSKLVFQSRLIEPVYKTLSAVGQGLPDQTALIGFCGGPWTVAAYMIDGTSRNGFSRAKMWAAEKSQTLDRLLEILVDASEIYLCGQIEAGAEIIQIFESWAGLLEGPLFERWIIKPTAELIRRIKNKHPHIPVIGFPRGAGTHYRDYARMTNIDALSIDQNISLPAAREELQSIKTLQGNLDPVLLLKGGDDMRRATMGILEQLGPRHIFNLGHGVLPETPPEHVAQLVSFVRDFRI